MNKNTWLHGEIYRNRRLVFSLAKNDFKTKYAGSYFGTVWAFVQPIVTICVYWFVFGLALRNGSDKGVPFVLWLIAGLVPWFFIQEGLIVQGYRDSLINKVAIWEHPVLTLYFWGFTLIVFVLGTRLFKKLQVHFADVL